MRISHSTPEVFAIADRIHIHRLADVVARMTGRCGRTRSHPPFRIGRHTWPGEPIDPFFNVNTAQDLAEAERLAAIEDPGKPG